MCRTKIAAIALASVAFALASWGNAAANHWREMRPDLALRLRAGDAVALSRREDIRLTHVVHAAVSARAALSSSPLTTPAMRQLAQTEASANRIAIAERLITLAHNVSRRDLATELWLIEDASSRGNLRDALEHYDIALSMSYRSSEVLFPVLSAAISEPEIRAGLVPYVRDGRPWVPAFLWYATASENSVRGVAQLMVVVALPADTAAARALKGLDAQILSQLATRREFGTANEYILRLVRGRRQLIDDIGFSNIADLPDLGPFVWQLEDKPEFAAEIGGDGVMRVRITADRHAPVAQRLIMILPGSYDFTQTVSFPDATERAAARWEWRCLSEEPDELIWAQSLPVNASSETYTSRIVIPDRCGAVALNLIASGGEMLGDAEVALGGLKITRR